jgi:hypothetical protein
MVVTSCQEPSIQTPRSFGVLVVCILAQGGTIEDGDVGEFAFLERAHADGRHPTRRRRPRGQGLDRDAFVEERGGRPSEGATRSRPEPGVGRSSGQKNA